MIADINEEKARGISEADVKEKVFLENVAVKKLLEPSNVANYVAYLASEEA